PPPPRPPPPPAPGAPPGPPRPPRPAPPRTRPAAPVRKSYRENTERMPVGSPNHRAALGWGDAGDVARLPDGRGAEGAGGRRDHGPGRLPGRPHPRQPGLPLG